MQTKNVNRNCRKQPVEQMVSCDFKIWKWIKKYYLKETKAPDGYTLNTTEYSFTAPQVNDTNNSLVYESKEIVANVPKGKFTITDARLMTSAPKGGASASASDVKSSSDDKKASSDSKSSSSTESKSSDSSSSKDSSASSASASSSSDSSESVGGGATAAPTTGSATYPIAIAIGGIVVAGAALVASKKMKIQ